MIKEKVYDSNKWNEFIKPTEEEADVAFEIVIRNNTKFDAIIIDEAQDFRETWWIVIEALSDNLDSKIIYIFYDDNQSLLPFRSKLPFKISPIVISKNCRNCGNIFEVVKKFHE